MSLRYSIAREDSIIQVRTAGVFDYVKAFEMWEQIVLACATHGCTNILGLSCVDRPLPKMDAYDHVDMLNSVGITSEHRIAWVAVNPILLDGLHDTATAISERTALNLRIFETKSDAIRWLEAPR